MTDALDRYLAWEVEAEPVEEVVALSRILVEEGADVNAVDPYGRSRLYNLVFGLSSAACPVVSVEALVALGADVRVGPDPLGAAVWGCDDELRPDKAAVIDLLVTAGCDVHNRDDAGLPLIEGAVCPYSHGKGYRSSDGFSCTSVLRLVAHGVDADFRCQDGDTLLHRACREGSLDAVCGLLDAGASLFARTADGRSPLELAEECANALRRSEPLRQYPDYAAARIAQAEEAIAMLRAAGSSRSRRRRRR